MFFRVIVMCFLLKSVNSQIEEVCYPGVGYMNTSFPFNLRLHRSFPVPQSPEKIGIRFLVSSRNSETEISPLFPNLDKLPTTILLNNPTAFIIHDHKHSPDNPYIQDLKTAIKNTTDYNIIMVDWSKSSNTAYRNAATNMRTLGRYTSKLAKSLTKQGLSSNFWCIGHGLGAHACGIFGKSYQKLKRITGLDPVKLGFDLPYPEVRLSMSDAEFVDIHHTDALKYGLLRPMGHVDFYYNGGSNQPACEAKQILTSRRNNLENRELTFWDRLRTNLEFSAKCSHIYSVLYFRDALMNTSCQYLGHSQENCTFDSCSPIGLFTEKYPYRGELEVKINANDFKPLCEDPIQMDTIFSSEKVTDIAERMSKTLRKQRYLELMEERKIYDMLKPKALI